MILVANRANEKKIKTNIVLMMEMNVNITANPSDIKVRRWYFSRCECIWSAHLWWSILLYVYASQFTSMKICMKWNS